MREIVAMKNRELKKEAFEDCEKALKILSNNPNLFSENELVNLGNRFRGAAIYINSNDTLREKIDKTAWLSVMASYSWEVAIKYNSAAQNSFKNVSFL